LSEVKIDDSVKKELVVKVQKYFDEELNQEIGSFDAEFLLDFFSDQLGKFYYNQGLADALSAFEGKIEDFSDTIFQLEKDVG
jgi:uncharacterized protein (DUF2164 family)